MKKPLFIVALILMAACVCLELGSGFFLASKVTGGQAAKDLTQPGYGVMSLALVDGILLYTIVLMGVALLAPASLLGRLQGFFTLGMGLVVAVCSVLLVLTCIALLVIMVTLLMAIPFGTLVYFIVYGSFETGRSAATLSTIFTLKLAFAVCLVLAHARFLQNKGLILMFATSIAGNLLMAALHGFPPGFLVSITDTLGAILMAVLAIIWAVILLFGSLISIKKAIL